VLRTSLTARDGAQSCAMRLRAQPWDHVHQMGHTTGAMGSTVLAARAQAWRGWRAVWSIICQD